MQAERQPEFPLLYSLPGFRYADLLLAPAERAAWQLISVSAGGPPAASNPQTFPREESAAGDGTLGGVARDAQPGRSAACAPKDALTACAEAHGRANQTLERARRAPNASLLSVAL